MSCCDRPSSAPSTEATCCAVAPKAPAAPSQSSCCASSAPSCGVSAAKSSCCGPPAQASACCDTAQSSTASACTPKAVGLTKPSCCDSKLPQGSEVKKQVRADYALVAVASAHNADAVAAKFGYTQDELAAIPDGANMGVSCGNPLALANVKEGEVVVDLGCGRGLDVFLASNKVGATGKVYGIDMTPEMLAKARENAAKRNVTNVEFLQGDIEALPLPDSSVDLVISNCVLNLVPDKQKAFTEIYRILKPGGRLAVSDILQKKPLPVELRDKIELFSTCFVGAMTHSAAVDYLQNAGFKAVLISDANVDLNAYKMLVGEGCCGSNVTFKLDIDFNEYTFSGKIFASKD